MNMSDRIAIMDGGRLVQVGPPREVYERPNSAFAGRFLGEANMIAGIADGTTLRTSSGIAYTAANARNGASLLFVRPEKLSLQLGARTTALDENKVSGTVCRSAFLGNVIRTELLLDSSEVLTIDAANGPGASLLAPGTQATAVWAAAESRLLAA